MKKHTGSMVSYFNMTTQAAKTSSHYIIKELEVSKIIRNEKNFYSIQGIEEMANSLAVSNHIPPLEVIDNKDGTYRLISGERRLSATLLRIERGELEEGATLPCHILPDFKEDDTLTKEQQETLAVILANNYRDKSPLDKLKEVEALEPIARSIYESEKEQGNLKEDGKNPSFRAFFAQHILNISESALQRLKDLVKLTENARQAFEDGRIGKTVAERLATYSEEQQAGFMELLDMGAIQGSLADLNMMFCKKEETAEVEDSSNDTVHKADEVSQEDSLEETIEENSHHSDEETVHSIEDSSLAPDEVETSFDDYDELDDELEDMDEDETAEDSKSLEETLEDRGQMVFPTMEREKEAVHEDAPINEPQEELSTRQSSTLPSAPPVGNSVTEEEKQSNRWIVDMLGLKEQLQDLLSIVQEGIEEEKDPVQLAELRVREACINLWIERYCV